ncbi:MAG TPA: hypothetical protein VGH83_11205 [Candidatus Acidoferrum sp.]|jgi:chromosome segregation ATPase
MRSKSWVKVFAAVSALLFVSLPIAVFAQDASQQTTDPVADAARRSREAKQNAAKPKKVYTEDDLSRPKPAPPAATDASGNAQRTPTTPDTTATQANAASGDQDAKTEAAWRKRFQEQRDKIVRAEKELDVLQREDNKAQVQYYPDPQKAMNEQYTRKEISEKDAKIAGKQQEIAQLKQGLSDLEDELRKAGGDPGWAR